MPFAGNYLIDSVCSVCLVQACLLQANEKQIFSVLESKCRAGSLRFSNSSVTLADAHAHSFFIAYQANSKQTSALKKTDVCIAFDTLRGWHSATNRSPPASSTAGSRSQCRPGCTPHMASRLLPYSGMPYTGKTKTG